jgi:hypothetical protein
MLLCAGSLFFLFVPLPKIISVPAEVSLNFSTSQKIIQQTMTGKEFWFGTGPGTYLFNYTKFRPLEVNQTAFWKLELRPLPDGSQYDWCWLIRDLREVRGLFLRFGQMLLRRYACSNNLALMSGCCRETSLRQCNSLPNN